FLLFLPLCLPHPPYAAPEPWHSMFSETDVGELRPPDLEDKPDFYLLIREYRQLGANSESISKTVHARYLGMIAYMDHLFGQLIQALNQSELKEETAVFVCSDHGDWAGDYGLVEKWPTGMDDCLTRIPFLAQIPGGKPGHTVEEPIELFDMMATILELADIEPRHSHFAQSLVPQLRGATGDSKRYVFTEGGYDIHEPHCFEGYESHPAELEGNMYSPKMKQQQEHPESVSRTTCIRSLDHKLIFRHQGVCELYDYKTDPRELINQYDNPNYSEVRARLEKELMNWFQRTSDVTPFERDARGIPHGNFLHQSLPVETFSV
ncbi:MAG: sulfatase-like hydrolase/transferase, partial [Verrucomicrobiota bacterium]